MYEMKNNSVTQHVTHYIKIIYLKSCNSHFMNSLPYPKRYCLPFWERPRQGRWCPVWSSLSGTNHQALQTAGRTQSEGVTLQSPSHLWKSSQQCTCSESTLTTVSVCRKKHLEISRLHLFNEPFVSNNKEKVTTTYDYSPFLVVFLPQKIKKSKSPNLINYLCNTTVCTK